jgi:hypothetical protein
MCSLPSMWFCRTTMLLGAGCISTGSGRILDPWSQHERFADGAEQCGE